MKPAVRITALAIALGIFGLVATSGTAAADTAHPAAPQAAVDREPPPVTFSVGEGEPQSTVIFMHGMGSGPQHNNNLIRTLLTPPKGSPAVRVISIWMRPQTGLHTMTDQLARARAAIDAQPGPVTLMGHSFGAKAAVKLAAEYPEEKVKSVVALAPAVGMIPRFLKRYGGQQTMPAPHEVRPIVVDVQRQFARKLAVARAADDPHAIAANARRLEFSRQIEDLLDHDEHGIERNVTRPVLVIHGTDDEQVSIGRARGFAARNKGTVKLVELPAVDHNFRHPEMERHEVAATMRGPVQRFLANPTQDVRAAAADRAAAKPAPAPRAR